MNTPRILIFGTIAIDTLITTSEHIDSVLGGSGSYAAIAARILSPHARLIGVIGDDFPEAFKDCLAAKDITLDYVEHIAGRNFAWTGRYAEDMNNRETLELIEGVQETWSPIIPEELKKCEIVLACNVIPRLQWAMLRQCRPESFIMVDFMKTWIERERDYVDTLLKRADIALMNDEEAACFSQTEDILEAGRKILQTGTRYAIIKHGSEGSSLMRLLPDGNIECHHCPAYSISDAIDPTGAGDSYMGAFAAYLSQQIPANLPKGKKYLPSWDELCEAQRQASCVAASTCQSFGPTSLLKVTKQDIQLRLKQWSVQSKGEA